MEREAGVWYRAAGTTGPLTTLAPCDWSVPGPAWGEGTSNSSSPLRAWVSDTNATVGAGTSPSTTQVPLRSAKDRFCVWWGGIGFGMDVGLGIASGGGGRAGGQGLGSGV
jgi:hypothetical protein